MTIIIILLLIWEIYWKAHALWIAARKGDNFFRKNCHMLRFFFLFYGGAP